MALFGAPEYLLFITIFNLLPMTDYSKYITIESGKRSGKPCIRGMRITVYDVLGYLSAGMSIEEVLEDFPELTRQDILACLAFEDLARQQ